MNMDASLELVNYNENNKISVIKAVVNFSKRLVSLFYKLSGDLSCTKKDTRRLITAFDINYILLRDLQFQLASSIYCSQYCCWMDHHTDFCKTK